MAVVIEEARRAGLRTETPSLADVGRRRLELYALAVVVVSASVLLGTAMSEDVPGLLAHTPAWVIRAGFAALGLAFLAYVAEKEGRLRRLEVMLVDERVRIAEMSRLDALKSEFLSTLSHELKGPLTAIVGSAATVRRVDLDPGERDELLSSVDRNARRLASMIDQLLVAGRMAVLGLPGAGRTEVDPAVEDVVDQAARLGRNVEHHGDVACEVALDVASLRAVLSGLLENAYQHGAAPVEVAVERHGATVTISVVDAGPGVLPEARERLFTSAPGSGREAGRASAAMGLAEMREQVESAGGQMWVDESTLGGAAFRVMLPAPVAAEGRAPASSAGVSSPSRLPVA